jgi:Rrf2 family iron-sulfur cluster assembly transcriptional regulator
MILGSKARYAVMAMVELAGYDAGKPVTLAQLAEKQEFTVPYLEQIFRKLKQRGLVKSVRGPGGGYVIGKPADVLRISEIVQAVEESLKMTRCENMHKKTGCMASGVQCLTHDLWDGLEQQIHNYLYAITLADIRKKRTIHIHDAMFMGDSVGHSITAAVAP